jgi:hypothetical protein
LTLVVNALPSITTPSLPNAGLNVPYAGVTFAASGGTTPYVNWSATNLPPGLSLSSGGVLSGTATVAGTYNNINVTVTDSSGATGVRTYNGLVVATPPRPTNVTLGGNNGTAGSGDTVTIVFSDPMNVTSFCDDWSGSTGSLTGNGDVTVTITDAGANDVLTVSVASCPFNFGSVTLGGNYVATTRTFSGNGGNKSTISYSGNTLVIMLGNASGSVNTGVVAGVPVYTPSAAITGSSGIPINTAAVSGTSSRF